MRQVTAYVKMKGEHGKLRSMAALECGHALPSSPTNNFAASQEGRLPLMACPLCPPVKPKKPEPVVAPTPPTDAVADLTAKVNKLTGMVLAVTRTLKELESRLTQIEDVKTAPQEPRPPEQLKLM